MNNLIYVAALSLFGAANLSAQVIDVDQPNVNAVMASFGQGDLAQSFQPTMSTCSGAGVSMSLGWGASGTFTAELWNALPNAGGTMLASGSVAALPGTWADVTWAPVSVTPGTTYYIVYTCTDSSMAIDGDTSNPYAGGMVFANPGYNAFVNYDYTFRTWSGGGMTLTLSGAPGGSMTFTVSGATANSPVAYIYAFGTGSHARFNPISGNMITTGLSSLRFTVAIIVTADASGNFSFNSSVPAGAAGVVHMQAVDAVSDGLSGVIGL
jgi:hypothetical protein